MWQLRSCSVRRYRIEGRLPSIHDEAFHRRLLDHRFRPLAPNETLTYGWVTVDNLLVTQFDEDTIVRGEYAVLGLRVDRRRPNAKLLKAHLDLALAARWKAATEDGGRVGRLTRDERREIRRGIEEELLRQTSPTIGVTPVLVHTRRRLLLALSRSQSLSEILVRLVRDTFGVELAHLTPFGRGGEILAGTEAGLELEALDRTDFGRVPSRTPAGPAGGARRADRPAVGTDDATRVAPDVPSVEVSR